VQPDGYWCGPLPSNATVTAEWIFFLHLHRLPINDGDRAGYTLHFLLTQETDGSWAIAPEYPYGGNLSCTIEAYFALKMLGLPTTHNAMLKACDFILSHGGMRKCATSRASSSPCLGYCHGPASRKCHPS